MTPNTETRCLQPVARGHTQQPVLILGSENRLAIPRDAEGGWLAGSHQEGTARGRRHPATSLRRRRSSDPLVARQVGRSAG
jgi:hypothetical protein